MGTQQATEIESFPEMNPWKLDKELWNQHLNTVNTRIFLDTTITDRYVFRFIFSLRKHHHHWGDLLLVTRLWRIACVTNSPSTFAGYWITSSPRKRKKSEAIDDFFQEIHAVRTHKELYENYEDLYQEWKKITPQTRAELLCGPRRDSALS